jgi:hypothetical protein
MKSLVSFSVFVFLLFSACRPPIHTFYWGEYSSTLYEYKKNPDNKTLEAHKAQILVIFEKSKDNDLKVPPGVNAEYGYILLKEGNEKEGMEYLDREMVLYPESVVFLKRIKLEYDRSKK